MIGTTTRDLKARKDRPKTMIQNLKELECIRFSRYPEYHDHVKNPGLYDFTRRLL